MECPPKLTKCLIQPIEHIWHFGKWADFVAMNWHFVAIISRLYTVHTVMTPSRLITVNQMLPLL